jgi:hypothetical protein
MNLKQHYSLSNCCMEFQVNLDSKMDAIIKKIKSLSSLRSNTSSKSVIRPSQSSLFYESNVMQRLSVPKVLYTRYPDYQWENLGKNLKTSTIQDAQQRRLVVGVLEDLVDLMLDEAGMEEIDVVVIG